MTNSISEASREVARLSRELDITNADHIALWIEANTIPDEPMSQCASWLACRIVEAHEAEMSRASQPVDTGVEICDWCNGAGVGVADTTCNKCDGSGGITLDSEAVEVVRQLRKLIGCNMGHDDGEDDIRIGELAERAVALLSLVKPVGGE